MKSTSWNSKKRFGITTSLMALSFVFVLSSFGTALAKDHSFKIKQTAIGPSGWGQYGDVTASFSDRKSEEKKINYNQTGEWKSSKCLTTITGKLVVQLDQSSVRIQSLAGQNVCQDAEYEIRWTESAQSYQFIRTK